MGAAGVFEQVLANTRAQKLPAFGAPERLVGAVTALVEDAKQQNRGTAAGDARVPPSFALPGGTLDEVGAKEVMENMGLSCPERVVCTSRTEAAAAFGRFGGPMVVKVLDATILHKTEVGGVHVNVRTPDDLDRALSRIDAIPGPQRRYLLEAMAPPGLELIIGAVRDPSFGPVIVVGLGGTLAEAVKDVSRRLAPITAADAEQMLKELRGYALLQGWRGAPAVSHAAITHAMLAVSTIIVGFDTVSEVEINPFRAYPDGGLVLDALLVTGVASQRED
jgi:acetyltransferase